MSTTKEFKVEYGPAGLTLVIENRKPDDGEYLFSTEVSKAMKYEGIQKAMLDPESPMTVIATIGEKRIGSLPRIILPEYADIEQLALMRFPKLNLSEISDGTDLSSENRFGFIEGYKAAKSKGCFTEKDMINLIQSLMDYTHESHNILGHDDRTAKELFDIHMQPVRQSKQIESITLEMEFDNGGYSNTSNPPPLKIKFSNTERNEATAVSVKYKN